MLKCFWLIPAILILQIPGLADVVPSGTEIPVRSDGRIDVSRWERSRIYPAHVDRDVYARDGDLAIAAGSPAELIVRQTGPNEYTLDLESVTVNDRRYTMDTTGPEFNTVRRDYDSGSAVLGAIAGAIAGATGGQVESRGAEIRVPAGAVITYRLQEPMRVVNWRDPGYNEGGHHYHREHDWYR